MGLNIGIVKVNVVNMVMIVVNMVACYGTESCEYNECDKYCREYGDEYGQYCGENEYFSDCGEYVAAMVIVVNMVNRLWPTSPLNMVNMVLICN